MLVLQVFCSLIGWFCLYLLFCCTFAQRGAEWSCRLVTLSHGVIIVLLTAYVLFVDGPLPFTHAGTENTELQSVSLAVCLGYFFFDMCWCVCFHTEGPSHARSSRRQHRWDPPGVDHGRFRLGLYDSLLGDAVDLLFIFLFATVRVGVGTVLFYCEVTSPRTTLIMKLGGVAMYTLAWVFMVDIARFCCKKSRAKYKKWQENHKLKEAQKVNGKSE
ncbi:hypothetical protein CgunFtcFv8_002583 [Champsocephalus gunnari]|uniref:Transmembrane protein 136 n=1 Tax=Champsocephalus gunnari TaxID=52237 RepID=A0AAN8HJL6_CHAGU|nr:hypothetical protein CgunFtcFv8_002583 [Champsocephalus gunnari]